MVMSLRVERSLFKKLIIALLFITLVLFLIPAVYIVSMAYKVSLLRTHNPIKTEMMRLRISEAKKEGKDYSIDQRWIPLSKMSQDLIHAVVCAEDDRFYQHDGFDWERLSQAAQENMAKGKFVRGASTITQQLAKNLFLTPERTISRKIKEAIYTFFLEWFLTKNRILEIYLNSIEWGDGIFGAESASQSYYKKNTSKLTLDQAMSLAAIIPNPRVYSPRKNDLFLRKRKHAIKRLMRYYHYIGEGSEESHLPPPAATISEELSETNVLVVEQSADNEENTETPPEKEEANAISPEEEPANTKNEFK